MNEEINQNHEPSDKGSYITHETICHNGRKVSWIGKEITTGRYPNDDKTGVCVYQTKRGK